MTTVLANKIIYFLKKYIIIFFYLIRRILTILKISILPIHTSTPPLTPYDRHLNDQIDLCYETFQKYFTKSIFIEKKRIHKFIIERAKENDKNNNMLYAEFGVWKGFTANYFSKFVNKIYAFDSFEGLKEDWLGQEYPKGHFDLNKQLPKLNKNVEPVVGWVQDTLIPFLEEKKPEINFLHMDVDTYESTKFILENVKPYMAKNSIILFDELYNHIGWDVGEYKALKEIYKDDEYNFICFAKDGEQAAIRII